LSLNSVGGFRPSSVLRISLGGTSMTLGLMKLESASFILVRSLVS
jgi:hypothetical protein